MIRRCSVEAFLVYTVIFISDILGRRRYVGVLNGQYTSWRMLNRQYGCCIVGAPPL